MFYPCHAYEYLSLALLYNYSLSINLIRFLNFSSTCFLFPMLSAFLFFRFNCFSFVISSYALFDSFFPFYFLSFVIIELLDILQTYIASRSIVTAIKLPQFLSFSSSKSFMIIYTGRFKTGSILWKLSLNVGNTFTYQRVPSYEFFNH